MRIWIVLVWFCTLGLVSCHSTKPTKKTAAVLKEKHIFNLEILNTEFEKNIGFPLLFDHEAISKNLISKISRKIYQYTPSNDLYNKSTIEQIKEKRDYFFNKQGFLIHVKHIYYIDETPLETLQIIYHEKPDQYGYAAYDLIETNGKHSNKKIQLNQTPFNLHQKIRYSSKALKYQIQGTKNYLYCMVANGFQDPLSIDSICKPKPTDFIMIGHPKKHQKMYQVKNLAMERNVFKKHYQKGVFQYFVQSQKHSSTKRSILTDQQKYMGYIDSTFSDHKHLYSNISTIKWNDKILPYRINYSIEHTKNQKKPTGFELIDYAFY